MSYVTPRLPKNFCEGQTHIKDYDAPLAVPPKMIVSAAKQPFSTTMLPSSAGYPLISAEEKARHKRIAMEHNLDYVMLEDMWKAPTANVCRDLFFAGK